MFSLIEDLKMYWEQTLHMAQSLEIEITSEHKPRNKKDLSMTLFGCPGYGHLSHTGRSRRHHAKGHLLCLLHLGE